MRPHIVDPNQVPESAAALRERTVAWVADHPGYAPHQIAKALGVTSRALQKRALGPLRDSGHLVAEGPPLKTRYYLPEAAPSPAPPPDPELPADLRAAFQSPIVVAVLGHEPTPAEMWAAVRRALGLK